MSQVDPRPILIHNETILNRHQTKAIEESKLAKEIDSNMKHFKKIKTYRRGNVRLTEDGVEILSDEQVEKAEQERLGNLLWERGALDLEADLGNLRILRATTHTPSDGFLDRRRQELEEGETLKTVTVNFIVAEKPQQDN